MNLQNAMYSTLKDTVNYQANEQYEQVINNQVQVPQ